MSELFTSGSVGGGAGNCPFYPAGDPACSRRVSGAKSQKIEIGEECRKVKTPGREVELSSKVLGEHCSGSAPPGRLKPMLGRCFFERINHGEDSWKISSFRGRL